MFLALTLGNCMTIFVVRVIGSRLVERSARQFYAHYRLGLGKALADVKHSTFKAYFRFFHASWLHQKSL